MTSIGRLERFEAVPSTQTIVRDWLDHGEDEICVAVADRQTAGRGRLDRTWQAASGTSLLLSIGCRPRTLPLALGWRVPAVVTMAMRDAAADVAALDLADIGLKWPNDLAGRDAGTWRKLAGVLSQATIADAALDGLIVGIGVNVDWRRRDFPPDLAAGMTSLSELADGAPVDRERVLERFLILFAQRYALLRAGRFETSAWSAAQLTTGADVTVDTGREVVRGAGLPPDVESGALHVRDHLTGQVRAIGVGDVVRCRIESAAQGV